MTITPINSNGDTKETASFNYDYTKFKNNIQIYGSNKIDFIDSNNSTKLTPKTPIIPQLIAPIIIRVRHILYNVFMYIPPLTIVLTKNNYFIHIKL